MLLPLQGPPAFSPAALDKKLARVRAQNPGVSALAASFVHLCDVTGELAPERAEHPQLGRAEPGAVGKRGGETLLCAGECKTLGE